MDEIQLQDLNKKYKHLKHKFLGVFAADNFSPHIPNNAFDCEQTLRGLIEL